MAAAQMDWKELDVTTSYSVLFLVGNTLLIEDSRYH